MSYDLYDFVAILIPLNIIHLMCKVFNIKIKALRRQPSITLPPLHITYSPEQSPPSLPPFLSSGFPRTKLVIIITFNAQFIYHGITFVKVHALRA